MAFTTSYVVLQTSLSIDLYIYWIGGEFYRKELQSGLAVHSLVNSLWERAKIVKITQEHKTVYQRGITKYTRIAYGPPESKRNEITKAVKYHALAANQGDAESQVNLGSCYENGEGVPQDMTKAVEYYTLAANQGDAESQAMSDFVMRMEKVFQRT